VWKLQEVHLSVKNHLAFANNILKRKKSPLPPKGVPRCLRVLAITVLYQMVGFAFVNKIENLEERVSKHNRRVQKQKQTDKNSAMFEMFVLLRDRFFVQFHPRSTVSIAGFHNVFGYNAFVKLLVARATKTERLKLH
jgi:hypothetical protein